MAIALPSSCSSSRYQADDFVLLFIPNGVGDEEEDDASGQTQCSPAKFAAFQAILLSQSVRIGEHQYRILETHAMLSRVRPGLGFVPFKADH
jgi:hypothetical protein